MDKFIVKRKGHNERFDERKTYASIYAACLNTELAEQECERIANKITKQIKNCFKHQKCVDSAHIKKDVLNNLRKVNSQLAFMYESHLDIN